MKVIYANKKKSTDNLKTNNALSFKSIVTLLLILLFSGGVFGQIEICTNGVDDDGDGNIDCLDSDCTHLITCNDIDGDGIINVLDSDNDNDGIVDVLEGYETSVNNTGIINWLHFNDDATQDAFIVNYPVTSMTTDVSYWNGSIGANPVFVNGQGGDQTVGPGITRTITDGGAFITGADQLSLQAAIVDGDYVEYSFTTATGFGEAYFTAFSTWDNVPEGSSQDWTAHYRSVFISYDNFTTFENLIQDQQVTQTFEDYAQEQYFGNQHVIVQENMTYKVRVYFYTSADVNRAQIDDFGLLINRSSSIDTDGDGTADHLDTDADNDGCLDAAEGSVYSIDPTICFSGYEICDNGIDDDADGLTDCADPDCKGDTNCPKAFACESALYQVLSGQLKIFDPASLEYTPIGTAIPSYNGTGYNVQDGYIYGHRSQDGKRYLFKIFNDGTYETVGEITNGNDYPNYKADFDDDGNLVTYHNGVLYFLDVDQTPLAHTSINLTNTTGGSWPSNHDIVYNIVHDKFYLLTTDRHLCVIEYGGNVDGRRFTMGNARYLRREWSRLDRWFG